MRRFSVPLETHLGRIDSKRLEHVEVMLDDVRTARGDEFVVEVFAELAAHVGCTTCDRTSGVVARLVRADGALIHRR